MFLAVSVLLAGDGTLQSKGGERTLARKPRLKKGN